MKPRTNLIPTAALPLLVVVLLLTVPAPARAQAGPGADAALAALAGRPAVLGPPAPSLVGSHHGVLACGDNSYRMELAFTLSAAGVPAARVAMRQVAGGPQAGAPAAQAGVASYDPSTGRLQISADARQPLSPAMPSLLPLRGVVLPDGSGWLLRTGWAGQACTAVTLRPGRSPPREWAFFDALTPGAMPRRGSIFDLPGALLRLPERLRGGCPDSLTRWVAQLGPLQARSGGNLTVQWNLFTDPHFVPFFGKPFFTLDDSEREALAARAQGECMKAYAEPARLLLGGVIDAFRMLPGSPRIQVAATNIAQQEARRWMEQVLRRLAAADTAMPPETVDALLQAGEPFVNALWPTEQAQFKQALADSRGALLARGLGERLRAAAGGGIELFQLHRLAQEVDKALRTAGALSAQQGQALEAQLGEVLDREGPAAMARHAAAANAPADVEKLQRWSEHFATLAARTSPAGRAAVQAAADEGAELLIRRQVEEGRKALANRLSTVQPPAERLQRLTAFAAETRTLSTPFLQGPTWAAWLTEMSQARQPTLAAASGEVLQQLAQAGTGSEIERLAARYLVPEDRDTPAGHPIAAAVDERLARLAPLRRLPGGAYLDAIYAADFAQAQAMDAAVATALRQGLRSTLNQLMGRPAGARSDALSEAMLNAGLANASLALPWAASTS